MIPVRLDKGEIQVSQVVKHGTSACEPMYNTDIVIFNIIHIDFRKGILVPAYDDGRLIAPEHENILVALFKEVLFGGKIKIWICMASFNDKHRSGIGLNLAFTGVCIRFPAA